MSASNPGRRPIDEETRARAVAMMQDTENPMGRNAIARELGVAASSVGLWAQEVGHAFDWSSTEVATAARRIQAADIRENLALALLHEAHRSLNDLRAPAVMIQFEQGRVEAEYDGDGKIVKTTTQAGQFREHILDEPTFSDKRNIMTVVGIAISKAAEVSRPQAGQGAEQGAAVLQRLARAIDRMSDEDLADVDPTEVPTS